MFHKNEMFFCQFNSFQRLYPGINWTSFAQLGRVDKKKHLTIRKHTRIKNEAKSSTKDDERGKCFIKSYFFERECMNKLQK